MATISEALAIAIQHHQNGRLEKAEQIYQQILAVEPLQADAIHLLGMLAHKRGKHELAVAYIEQAIELQGNEATFHNNLGTVFHDQRKLDEAVACYRWAMELKPEFVEAQYNLANAYRDQGKFDEAVVGYRRVSELKPAHPEAHNNRGNILKDEGKLDEAVACYRRALELKPNYVEAHNNLGCALRDQGQLDEALACFRRSLELMPDNADMHSNLAYALHFHPDFDAAAIFAEHRRWNRQFGEPLSRLIKRHANERSTNRRLRIGYFSPDFRNHVLGRNMLPLFREHDHQQFEIFVYSAVRRSDELTSRFQAYCDVWRDVVGLNDDAFAQQIRDDRIDILVDLTLHMQRNRLLVFARKPAPVQVTFAGYPGTTGLTAIDYRLSDVYLDPPGLFDPFYSEASLCLPDSFWCYEPLQDEPRVNGLPALENGYVTFGCLNNFTKINGPVLRCWANVLKAVEHSRLLLLAAEGAHRQRTLDFFAGEGIASERVTFVPLLPLPQYLELYHRIDIGLDTFPYNGHTTSLDSLWMGVPVITLVGRTVVGRAGFSQLSNLDMREWIADSAEDFVRIAVEFSRDLPHLSQLRSTLRRKMQASPLMDARRFTRHIEAAYHEMWKRYLGG